jgi:hypothetical protein
MRRRLLTGVALALPLGTGAPVWADDTADLKAQVEQIGVAYAEAFNKHDAAGLSALYTPMAYWLTCWAHVRPRRISSRACSSRDLTISTPRSIKLFL